MNFHTVTLAGDDAQRMNKALKEAGFVGEGTLINPARISTIEDAGLNIKVFLEGADRVVFMPKEIEEALFPARPSPDIVSSAGNQEGGRGTECTAAGTIDKPRRAKKEAA